MPELECICSNSWETWFLITVHIFSNLNRLAVVFSIIYWKTDFLCTNKVLKNRHHCFTIQSHHSVLQKSFKIYSYTRLYGCPHQLLKLDSPDTDMQSQLLWIPMWHFLVPCTLGRDWLISLSNSPVLHWVFHSVIHSLVFFFLDVRLHLKNLWNILTSYQNMIAFVLQPNKKSYRTDVPWSLLFL